MAECNSTAPAPTGKPPANKHRKRKPGKRHPGEPAKPYKGFPLFTVASGNGNGRWAKKVRGKLCYFGPWDDWEAALQLWNEQKDDLLSGRVPRARGGDAGPTLRELCNRFMTTKTTLRDAGELEVCTWDDYFRVCECLVQTFGRDRLLTDLLPEDFERLRGAWAQKWGPVRLGNEINRARVVFNYAYKNGLLDCPMRYGEGFKRPSRKAIRLARAEKGAQLFEPAELRRMVKAATQPIKAMIYLGLNCALGNTDIGRLPITALELKAGWLNCLIDISFRCALPSRAARGRRRGCRACSRHRTRASRRHIRERIPMRGQSQVGVACAIGGPVEDITGDAKSVFAKGMLQGRPIIGIMPDFPAAGCVP